MHAHEELLRREVDVIRARVAEHISQEEQRLDELRCTPESIRSTKKRLTDLRQSLKRLDRYRAQINRNAMPVVANGYARTSSPYACRRA